PLSHASRRPPPDGWDNRPCLFPGRDVSLKRPVDGGTSHHSPLVACCEPPPARRLGQPSLPFPGQGRFSETSGGWRHVLSFPPCRMLRAAPRRTVGTTVPAFSLARLFPAGQALPDHVARIPA